jgi:hypothetical protein
VYPQLSTGLLNKATLGLLFAVLFVSACTTENKLSRDSHNVIGTLYVTGNEPFTTLSLQTENGRIVRIRKDTSALVCALIKLQGQKLRVRFRPAESNSDTTNFEVEQYELVKIP